MGIRQEGSVLEWSPGTQCVALDAAWSGWSPNGVQLTKGVNELRLGLVYGTQEFVRDRQLAFRVPFSPKPPLDGSRQVLCQNVSLICRIDLRQGHLQLDQAVELALELTCDH